jgi:hypothetical protein
MNTSYSLHKVTDEDNCPFDETAYSWFKFGDKFHAEQFAKALYNGFISENKDLILEQNEIVILPSPYFAIPTASNFLCTYFKKYLDLFLYDHGKKASVESKIYRNQTYTTDYGNLDFEERMRLIAIDTYYIDRNFVANKFCIFVDDIKITGSHEKTVAKILNEYQVEGTFFFLYFAELVNKEIHPKIENKYNYFAIKSVSEIIEVVNRPHFQYNTRIVKYILSFEKTAFDYFITAIPFERQEQLFQLAISNNYHQLAEYQENMKKIHEIKKQKNFTIF